MGFGTFAFLMYLPLGVSIHAIILDYDDRARAGRRAFFLALLAISLVPALFVYGDLARLFSLPPLPFDLQPGVLDLAWVALAYPFYERQRRRIFDAGFSRHLAWLGLVPYLNYLFFVFLCLKSSDPDLWRGEVAAKAFD